MKTTWGRCKADAHRAWFDLELTKKPERCLEYIVVHVLIRVLERARNHRFEALLDRHLSH